MHTHLIIGAIESFGIEGSCRGLFLLLVLAAASARAGIRFVVVGLHLINVFETKLKI